VIDIVCLLISWMAAIALLLVFVGERNR